MTHDLHHRIKKFVFWGISIGIAVQMLAVGGMKIMSAMHWADNDWIVRFQGWGYPSWFPIIIGVAEITAAILIVTPKYALQGAAIIATVMYAALTTEFVYSGFVAALHPLIIFLLAATIFYVRWPRVGGIDPMKLDIAGEVPEDPDYEPEAAPHHDPLPKTTF